MLKASHLRTAGPPKGRVGWAHVLSLFARGRLGTGHGRAWSTAVATLMRMGQGQGLGQGLGACLVGVP